MLPTAGVVVSVLAFGVLLEDPVEEEVPELALLEDEAVLPPDDDLVLVPVALPPLEGAGAGGFAGGVTITALVTKFAGLAAPFQTLCLSSWRTICELEAKLTEVLPEAASTLNLTMATCLGPV